MINVLYVGTDASGIHISTKDVASLNLAEGGKVIIKGAQGIHRNAEDGNLYDWLHSGADHPLLS